VDFLIRAFSPDACIETGTFYGWTARYLASYGVPLYTVEILPGPYHVAKRYLQHLSNVTLICGDSAVAMRQLAGRAEIRRPFLYLDAHWQERVALFDDVRCAFSSWPDALIVIDDFHVPNDPGYGYDIYDGTPFALDEFEIPEGTTIAYPTVPAREETGARRGSVFLGIGADAGTAIERAEGTLDSLSRA
jgi:predicted O-methyltransferase YrrM